MTASSRRVLDILIVALTGIILAGSFAGAIALARGVDLYEGIDVCWSQQLLGRACPGCGLTRSFVAIAAGQLSHAMAYNPMGLPLFLAFAVAFLLHLARLLGAPLSRLPLVDGLLLAAVLGIALAQSVVFYW